MKIGVADKALLFPPDACVQRDVRADRPGVVRIGGMILAAAPCYLGVEPTAHLLQNYLLWRCKSRDVHVGAESATSCATSRAGEH